MRYLTKTWFNGLSVRQKGLNRQQVMIVRCLPTVEPGSRAGKTCTVFLRVFQWLSLELGLVTTCTHVTVAELRNIIWAPINAPRVVINDHKITWESAVCWNSVSGSRLGNKQHDKWKSDFDNLHSNCIQNIIVWDCNRFTQWFFSCLLQLKKKDNWQNISHLVDR